MASIEQTPLPNPENQQAGCGSENDVSLTNDSSPPVGDREAFFRAMFENMPVAYQSLDQHGNFLTINRAFQELLGYSREELIGRRFVDLLSEEDARRFWDNYQKFKSQGEIHGAEFRLRRKDGTVILVSISGKVGRDQNGGFRQTHCVAVDITEQRRSEEALRLREERLRLALEASSDGLWDWDLRSNHIYWSPRMYAMLGYEPDESGMTVEAEKKLIHPDDLKQAMVELDQQMHRGEGAFRVEFRMRNKSGGWQWVVTRGKPVQWGSNGQPFRLLGTRQDITERKWAEVALRDSESRYRALFEGAPNPIMVVDPRGQFLDANAAALAFLEMDRKTMLSKTVWDFLPQSTREADQIRQLPFSEPSTVEIQYDINGQLKTLLLNVVPLVTRDGLRLYGIGQDITRRKLSEDALRESEERNRTLLEAAPDAMFVLDEQGRIVEANQIAFSLYGYSREELLNMTIEDVTADEHRPEVHERFREAFASGAFFERVHQRRDGSCFPVEIVARPFSLGGRRYLLSSARDITDRKHAEAEQQKILDQFIHAQKMESVGRLAGGVAHDFNNMLGVIIGNAETALEQVDRDQPVHEHLMEILGAGQRSAVLTRQLLAFARRQTVSPKLMDLNAAVSGMLKMLQRLIGEEIELVWKPGNATGSVRMDPAQVDQILANLMVNARDAIDRVGTVTIETRNVHLNESYCRLHPDLPPGDYVMLAVSDTGMGMDEAVLNNLFEPFFTTKEGGKGTGLGLATVYGIVQQNGGGIHVYSEPGYGSTFKIYLPRMLEAEIAVVSEEQSPARGCETILMVEDEEAILKLGTRILERFGYTVLPARTPAEALLAARNFQGQIHLLITDVVMPGMNGRELKEALTALRPHIKCLYISGYTADVIAHHGILEADIHYLQKPFSVRGLAAMARHVLDGE